MRITIKPGVFHPGFFFSSLLLMDFILKNELQEKKMLELGAGAGLLSLVAASHGARVTASDISKTAADNISSNASQNKIDLKVFQSDLFHEIPADQFDLIVINPPYYKMNPVSEASYAWYCGENLEFYSRLFAAVSPYLKPRAQIYMVLSQDCDIAGIRSLAEMNNFVMKEVYRKKKYWEWNYIFEIKQE